MQEPKPYWQRRMEAEKVIGNELPGSGIVFVVENEYIPHEIKETIEVLNGNEAHADA